MTVYVVTNLDESIVCVYKFYNDALNDRRDYLQKLVGVVSDSRSRKMASALVFERDLQEAY